MRNVRLITYIGAAVVFVYLYAVAGAQPPVAPEPFYCPPNAPSCKVITITPDEEQSLVGPNMVFDHAEWANRAGLSGVVAAWRNKLSTALPGKLVPKEDPKKADPKK